MNYDRVSEIGRNLETEMHNKFYDTNPENRTCKYCEEEFEGAFEVAKNEYVCSFCVHDYMEDEFVFMTQHEIKFMRG